MNIGELRLQNSINMSRIDPKIKKKMEINMAVAVFKDMKVKGEIKEKTFDEILREATKMIDD